MSYQFVNGLLFTWQECSPPEAEGRVVLTVAYLANQFPAAVEPYVGDEIEELRSRGVRVVAGAFAGHKPINLRPPGVPRRSYCRVYGQLFYASALALYAGWKTVLPLVGRVILRGSQAPFKRIKALLHTWLGACYAVRLEGKAVDHIHVHHGYFGSWIAMVAARLLNTGFSLTLHGSDLLLHGAYLDLKLETARSASRSRNTTGGSFSSTTRRWMLQR